MAATSMAISPWETEDYARRYDEIVRGPYPFHKRAAPRLVEFAAPQSGQTVLDLGAGTGLVAEQVVRQHPAHIILADASAAMLRTARSHLFAFGPVRDTRLEFITCDAEQLKQHIAAASIDLVIASYAFGWFPDPQRVLVELAAIVKPGGTLVFDVPPPPEPEPRFLATMPMFGVFSREFRRLLRERLGYSPTASVRPDTPPDFAGYVSMALAAGFEVVDTLREDVPYTVSEIEAAWRYGWWFSAAANPALAKLSFIDVEEVVEDAILAARKSEEYAAFWEGYGVMWETYAALKVRKV